MYSYNFRNVLYYIGGKQSRQSKDLQNLPFLGGSEKSSSQSSKVFFIGQHHADIFFTHIPIVYPSVFYQCMGRGEV